MNASLCRVALILALLVTASLLLHATGGQPVANAVEPGVNCRSYAEDICEVEVGDIFFCDPSFEGIACASSIVAGQTVRWVYPNTGETVHTTTACGDDCNSPTDTPLWDSGVMQPGDTFDFTFDTPGVYLYQCEIHGGQLGLIRVLAPESTSGDVDCGGSVNAIDAALILQLSAGLLDELPCPENADVSQDGATNSIDAALVLQYTAGLIDSLPA